MKLIVLFLGVVLVFFSCKETRKDTVSELFHEWSGKQIIFPNHSVFTIQGKDTVDMPYLSSSYTIVIYIDSLGCTSCKLQLHKWKNWMKDLEGNNVSILFYIHPQNKKELNYILYRDKFIYPVCIDENDEFNRLNHFSSNISFQTFLLDKDNKVVAIGNPVHNPKVKLYLNIIQGNKDIPDSAKKIKTEVTVKNPNISFGEFDWKQEQIVEFEINNVGNKFLVIEDVSFSCGCISVDYTKEPIMPGKSVMLTVTYKAEHLEYFKKTLTVYCNTEYSPITLTLSGEAK